MNSARGFAFYVILGVTVIPVCLVLLLMKPFTDTAVRYDFIKAWGKFILGVLRVVCGVSWRAEGMENCPDEPVVVLCKHQSAWECFWLGCHLPSRCSYVYKKSLNRIPFFGWALWTFDMLSIDRADGRGAFKTFMQKGPEFLKKGWWLALFPEGTRVPPGERVKFKTGGARVASAAGVPILPIALNSGLCWPKNSIAKIPGTITVSVGKPIQTKGRPMREVETEAEEWIVSESERLASLGKGL